MTLFAGLDLGQAQDYTALTVLDQTQPPVVDGKLPATQYAVRGLRRWPLNTSYLDMVRDIRAQLSRPLYRAVDLVVDGSGCGRSVVDLFRGVGQRLVPVTIHGGAETIFDPETRYWRVPKRELAGVIQVLLQSRRLTIAPTLAEAATLTHELRIFKPKISASGHDSYGAEASGLPDDWREGPHDDLLLATALVCWYVERAPKPRPFSAAVGGHRVVFGTPEVGSHPGPGWPARDTAIFPNKDGRAGFRPYG